jgi:CDP-glucose 4,6-dehydratase
VHYLVTGHTGFKGAWLVLMLRAEGHTVSGIALDPIAGSLFETARVGELMVHDIRLDIRDADAVRDAVTRLQPDVVYHLAAQPLVVESYRDPRTTFETNVMGTLNILEAVGATPSVAAQVVITTDKVYLNVDQVEGYRESDALGAADPYSSSKAMADILTQSWVKSFPAVPTAIARGGNVIGGGDNASNRLVPDLVAAFANGQEASLRFPSAVRPWQHVLDCLDGYRAIERALLAGTGAGEWNIGPGRESFVTVSDFADVAAELWGDGARWHASDDSHAAEANLLSLDPTRASELLGWSSKLKYPESLAWVVEWHKSVAGGVDPRVETDAQVSRYLHNRELK